jgi:tRNA (guanine26-N2/guanine27-N2)-dimethyltransferase
LVREGASKLYVPKGSGQDPFHKLAFFNPAMALNRTISARALQAFFSGNPGGLVVDGLCATGARGIRYALEAKVPEVLFVDANPYAVRVLKRNITLNKLGKISEVSCTEFNSAMYDEDRKPAAWVEVDAFGSPAPFIQSALHAVGDGGVLSLTATDFAKLAGARPAACIRHYDAAPIHCWAGHELGLRIIIGRAARTAAMLDRTVTPLFGFYLQHAGKLMIRVQDSASRADLDMQNKMGFIYICNHCMGSQIVPASTEALSLTCEKCAKPYQKAGPLWIGQTSDSELLSKTLSAIRENRCAPSHIKQAEKLVSLTLEENELPPVFLDLHELCRRLNIQVPSFSLLMEKLKAQGYKCSRTHYAPTGIRTDASARQVSQMLKEC